MFSGKKIFYQYDFCMNGVTWGERSQPQRERGNGRAEEKLRRGPAHCFSS